MAFFIVTIQHPDEHAWREHLQEHMSFLHSLVASGVVRASGKIVDADVKTGCILLTAKDRADAESIVAKDPFTIHGVSHGTKIVEWDPFVGIFAAESSGMTP